MQQELNIIFKGPSVEAIAAQAAAFAKQYGTATAATTATAKGGKGAKAAQAAAAAEETESEEISAFGAEDETTEETFGDDAEETTEGDEDGGESFDDLAAEPANGKKSAKGGKTAAAPKVSLKDVNAALIKYTKDHSKSKEKTQALLKKHFKVESVNELKPEQYAAVIKAVTPPAKK